MADRTVPTTDTFDQWRTTYNLTGQDVGDIGNLNNAFSGTPTDLVEAINSKTTTGFSIAMAIALG
jgi:hypothetical protein|tara:strand:- start:1268 stop:1462 length:195 start_codon:yes stop_codon:yes gene_type:complete